MKHIFRSHVVFSDLRSTVTFVCQYSWKCQANHIPVGLELVVRMSVTVLTIVMVMQPRHDDRSTGGAAGGGCVGPAKHRTIRRQAVDCWRVCHCVSIATQGWALVIGDDKDDVSFCGKHRH